MKSLAIALGIVVAFAAVLFAVCRAFGVVTQVAGPIAGSALGLITFIHDKVEKSFSQSNSKITPGIVPVDAFRIRWPYMLLYSSLLFVGIEELGGLIVATPASLLAKAMPSVPQIFVFSMITIAFIPLFGVAIFVLGRWMAIRSAKAAYWLLPAALILGRAVDITLTSSSARCSCRCGRAASTARIRNRRWLPSLCFWPLSPAAGRACGLGTESASPRISPNSLLEQVSPATRDTLLAMTFEEAKFPPNGSRPRYHPHSLTQANLPPTARACRIPAATPHLCIDPTAGAATPAFANPNSGMLT